MKPIYASTDSNPGRVTPEHREYLIDHFRVSFHDDSSWNCGCREFTAGGICRHTREAAGMRAAQRIISGHVHGGKTGLRGHDPPRH
jgi:hypothetical protein